MAALDFNRFTQAISSDLVAISRRSSVRSHSRMVGDDQATHPPDGKTLEKQAEERFSKSSLSFYYMTGCYSIHGFSGQGFLKDLQFCDFKLRAFNRCHLVVLWLWASKNQRVLLYLETLARDC